jgi:GT2 family glycosyltransferase
MFVSDTYTGWAGDSERTIDWQSGCCVMFRSSVLKSLGGFDGQFFYHFEEVDLCRRVWNAGYPILYTPTVLVTHLGGQSVNRFPVRFELERYRSRYRYFYKHFGPEAARRCRLTILAWIRIRQAGWALSGIFGVSDSLRNRLEMYRITAEWNNNLDPITFVESGVEPEPMPTALQPSR